MIGLDIHSKLEANVDWHGMYNYFNEHKMYNDNARKLHKETKQKPNWNEANFYHENYFVFFDVQNSKPQGIVKIKMLKKSK